MTVLSMPSRTEGQTLLEMWSFNENSSAHHTEAFLTHSSISHDALWLLMFFFFPKQEVQMGQ